MPDMYGNRIIRTDRFFVPDAFINLIDRKHSAAVFDKQKQNIIFNRRQLHTFSIYRNFFRIIIDTQTAYTKQRIIFRIQTAQHRIPSEVGFYPCNQFKRIKRFRYIIVRPDIQSQDLISVFGFGGKNNDRNTGILSDF